MGQPQVTSSEEKRSSGDWGEILLLIVLFFVLAGTPPPAVNEAHYLSKAKNYWDPTWLQNDFFISSGKAHQVFYFCLGWPTQFLSLTTTAWLGRFVGWSLLAFGLQRLTQKLLGVRWVSIPLALVWIAAIRHGNLAGEWVLGGIEAKVPAYALVLIGWSLMLRDHAGNQRYAAGWVCLGAAAAFHVLVGGWAVVTTMIARALQLWRWRSRSGSSTKSSLLANAIARLQENRSEIGGLLLGGSIALLGLVPGLRLAALASEEEQALASQIYVYGRLGHHLAPASFLTIWYVRFGLITALAFVLAYSRRWLSSRTSDDDPTANRLSFVNDIALGALVIAVAGLMLGALPAWDRQLAADLLRYYWFRLSDAVIPLWLACAVSVWLWLPTESSYRSLSAIMRGLAIAILAAAFGLLAKDYLRDWQQPFAPAVVDINVIGRPMLADGSPSPVPAMPADEVVSQWRQVCDWIEQQSAPDAIFVTPRHQQTFKWYANRAEVVNWKDVPQDANSLVEWALRYNRIFPLQQGRRHPPLDRESLQAIARDFGASYLLLDRRLVAQLPELPQLYPEEGQPLGIYVLYALPSGNDDTIELQ